MPSFQSPLPMSGRPCAPAVRPLSIARTQCSKSDADVAETPGLRRPPARPARAAAPRGTAPARRARRCRRSCGRTPPPRTAARAGRPSSACACRGRSARATSAARRPRRTGGPPHANECSRARSGPRERERHDVLELIAEAEGAARLVVAERAQRRQLRSWYRSQRFMSRSNESSGVRTWTASRVSSQPRRTASSALSAAATWPWRAARSRACATSLPSPSRNTTRRVSPAASVTATCSAAHGSSPPRSGPRARAARAPPARASEPLRPRNDVRSPVAEASGSLA